MNRRDGFVLTTNDKVPWVAAGVSGFGFMPEETTNRWSGPRGSVSGPRGSEF
ncbi:MAG: hypothetical protein GW949_02075 [Spirochaetales bacterium]|nr:hypothetical protein [Spirochaetales bacterium]